MSKSAIIVIIIALFFAGRALYGLYLTRTEGEIISEGDYSYEEEGLMVSPSFISCLKESGVVIYGSSASQASIILEEEMGGIEMIDSIFLDCEMGTEREFDICEREKKTRRTLEIQIDGDLYGIPTNIRIIPKRLADITGCEL